MNKQPADVDAGTGRKDGPVGPGTIIRGIRRYRLLSLLLLAGTVVSAAGVWFFLPLPKLTAYTTFQISSQPQNLFTPVGDDRADFKLYCQAQSVLVKSRPVLEAAVKALDNSDRKPQILEGRGDKVGWLSSNLQVDFRSSPEFMRLSLEGDDAEDAKAVIDAVKTAYMIEVVSREKYRRRAFFKQLQSVAQEYETLLATQRRTVDQLAEGLGSSVPETLAVKERFVQEQLGMAERELLQIQSEMRRAEVEANKVNEKVKGTERQSVPDDALLEAVAGEPEYQKLTAHRDGIRESIKDMKQTLTPGARPLGLAQREQLLDEANKELDAYVEKVRPTLIGRIKANMEGEGKRSHHLLQDKMAILKDLETAINTDIKKLSKKLTAANHGQVALESYRFKMAQTQRMSDRISQELEQMRPELESPPRVSSWEEPNVTAGVEGNRRLKYSLMVGGVILLLSLGLITFLEASNRYVVRPEDAADNLGLRLIGTVPLVPRRLLRRDAASGSRQTAIWHWMLTESIDAMRTMLIHSPDAAKPRLTILIASAMPGEGKTMLASQLAASLARGGFRTLLIDADLRRPTLHRAVGVPVTPGLCDLLQGITLPSAAIKPAGVPGLSFIPAGAWNQGAAQALTSGRWPAVKAELEVNFDYIVIDSSPVLLVPDALLLARHVDGTVLSVLRNVSAVSDVMEARDRLQALGVNLFGVVVSGLGGRKYRATFYDRYASPTPPAIGPAPETSQAVPQGLGANH